MGAAAFVGSIRFLIHDMQRNILLYFLIVVAKSGIIELLDNDNTAQRLVNFTLLFKFGEKEHLEQLKKGIIHFSTLETFQKDPTVFRGDRLDGRLLLDPTKPLLIDGHDISPYIKEAIFSLEPTFPQLSFSASIFSKNISYQLSDGMFSVKQDFVDEMRKFGEHFLILNAFEFIDAVIEEFGKSKCRYEYHRMTYIDKHDHQQIQNYFEGLSSERRRFAHLFIKDTANSYPLQNEWRLVAFDTNEHYCAKGCNGINIQTGFSTQLPVFETEKLVTLRCTEDFLFD